MVQFTCVYLDRTQAAVSVRVHRARKNACYDKHKCGKQRILLLIFALCFQVAFGPYKILAPARYFTPVKKAENNDVIGCEEKPNTITASEESPIRSHGRKICHSVVRTIFVLAMSQKF